MSRTLRTVVLIAILVALVGVAMIGNRSRLARELATAHEVVTLNSGTFSYRMAGSFLRDSHPSGAPLADIVQQTPLDIMKYQVSAKDYARCVADHACARTFKGRVNQPDQPVTGVSFNDALAYARWLSQHTGYVWRLPTDPEWVYSAGVRFVDDDLGTAADAADPSRRWLLKYARDTARKPQLASTVVAQRGTFGDNGLGLFDQSGNVWEWTSTCFTRSSLDQDGGVTSTDTVNCGVRVVEGRHRTYMSDFVQDAKSGGCAVGKPPEFLGFRLVREEPPQHSFDRLRVWLFSAINV